MSDLLKYLGKALQRAYGSVVQLPLPWRMIDKIESLEEAEDAGPEPGSDVTLSGRTDSAARPESAARSGSVAPSAPSRDGPQKI